MFYGVTALLSHSIASTLSTTPASSSSSGKGLSGSGGFSGSGSSGADGAVFVSVLSSLYHAWKAASIDPVKALRTE